VVELAEQAGERTSRKEIVGVCIMGLAIGLAIALTSLPALTAISRRWERAADRYSLELTGDRTAYETAFRTDVKAQVSPASGGATPPSGSALLQSARRRWCDECAERTSRSSRPARHAHMRSSDRAAPLQPNLPSAYSVNRGGCVSKTDVKAEVSPASGGATLLSGPRSSVDRAAVSYTAPSHTAEILLI